MQGIEIRTNLVNRSKRTRAEEFDDFETALIIARRFGLIEVGTVEFLVTSEGDCQRLIERVMFFLELR